MADIAEPEPKVTENRKANSVNGVDGKDEIRKTGDGESSHGSKTGNGAVEEKKGDEKKPSKFKQLTGKIGLDVPTLMMMFK
jgi:hypothetical protein